MDVKLLKGTTLVGMMCKNGVILAADKRATAGYVVSKRELKLVQITDTIMAAQCGLVSDAQLLVKLVRAEIKLKDLQTNRPSTVQEVASLLAAMLYNNLRKPSMVPGIVGFLLAGVDITGPHLYNLGVDGSVTEVVDFDAEGSGSVFALGNLEANYKSGLTIDDGVKLAVKAVATAIERDINSGNGIDVVTITEQGIQWAYQKVFTNKLTVE